MACDNAIVPKHAFIAFILWLAIKDRLTTCDILAVWGWQDDVLYGFCRSKNGMQGSLVFWLLINSFSQRVWKQDWWLWLRQHIACEWGWLMRLSNGGECFWLEKALFFKVERIALAATVYHIWRQRNSRVHTGQFVAKLLKPILNYVRWRVCAHVPTKRSTSDGAMGIAKIPCLAGFWGSLACFDQTLWVVN